MRQPLRVFLVFAALVGVSPRPLSAQPVATDLDRFMAEVIARRDDNWRKLQQYVLDERETADFLGPGRIHLFGLDREYTWFIRDGVFVRSPVKVDGVPLGEDERRRAEQEWIERERSHQKDQAAAEAATRQAAPAPTPASAEAPTSVDAILRSTREPQFVSAAYFLRFKFEPGHYAFVGAETYEGRQVFRIEYYPSRLYSDEHEAKPEKPDPTEARLTRQMNKIAMVTLWVEPTEHQIVQYRFDNIALDFLPARSIVRVNGFGATMKMAQPFKGVWLPQGIDASGAFTLATGTYEAHYTVSYRDYREADVKVKIR
jgi:hypothetical protein